MSDMLVSPIIALITDFGAIDPFVGIMKGVIAKISPGIELIDITHNIPPGDIRRAAIILWQSKSYFPSGTIFLTVVDPGVGSSRRGLIISAGDHIYIGPDNGIFTFVIDSQPKCWELKNQNYKLSHPSTTFHGRDIFAPAAAYTANGVPCSEFGPVVSNLQNLPAPRLSISPGQIQGEILHQDRFGNLLTSLGKIITFNQMTLGIEPWLDVGSESSEKIRITKSKSSLALPDGRVLPWVETFADLPEDECGVVIGSSGLLELVANRKSAADLLTLSSGEIITLQF
jgi:S-adenosylmethionine hydrolase